MQMLRARSAAVIVASLAATLAHSVARPSDGAGDPVERQFSTTNVQVAGVDEPDFVKNDGDYIYLIVGDSLVVVDAWPPTEIREVGRSRIEGMPASLFLQGDRVAVLSTPLLSAGPGPSPDGAAPGPGTCGPYVPGAHSAETPAVKVTILDVTQREVPVVVRELYLEGGLVDARLLGAKVHLVTASLLPRADCGTDTGTPASRVGAGGLVGKNHGPPTVLTLWTIDMAGAVPPSSAGVIGAPGPVYASLAALFLASLRPPDATLIHKFTLGGEAGPFYVASGRIEGRVLNQFSMDEFDGLLRVATTTEASAPGTPPLNHVFVLGQPASTARRLKVVGAVRDLAPEERIYATRFVGERGYIVTFPPVELPAGSDGLVALDLRDPANPAAKGMLKLDGFSTYLHPVGTDHLLAIGNAADPGTGRVTGLDLSIFDVSDLANPVLAHRRTLAGAYSKALFEHAAFTYFEPERTLAIPLADWQSGFAGLEIYDATVEKGFAGRGRIDHADVVGRIECPRPPTVLRSVIIGSAIYSVSCAGIKVNDLRNPAILLGVLPLK